MRRQRQTSGAMQPQAEESYLPKRAISVEWNSPSETLAFRAGVSKFLFFKPPSLCQEINKHSTKKEK